MYLLHIQRSGPRVRFWEFQDADYRAAAWGLFKIEGLTNDSIHVQTLSQTKSKGSRAQRRRGHFQEGAGNTRAGPDPGEWQPEGRALQALLRGLRAALWALAGSPHRCRRGLCFMQVRVFKTFHVLSSIWPLKITMSDYRQIAEQAPHCASGLSTGGVGDGQESLQVLHVAKPETPQNAILLYFFSRGWMQDLVCYWKTIEELTWILFSLNQR